MLIRVGSRGSRLALTQADLAAACLRAPGIEIALIPITKPVYPQYREVVEAEYPHLKV